ncbi:hypothetical protein IAR55_005706 [Kwoniella newhampshirensis]|uniref:Uncharacterized protein n=1 Tax=Kwoniella newhampshirensis TaxID=1651941 RepID=A0AAW0YG20_9TREE
MPSPASTHPFLVDQTPFLTGRTAYGPKRTSATRHTSTCPCGASSSSSGSTFGRNSSSTSLSSLGSSKSSTSTSAPNSLAYSALTSPYAPPTPNSKECKRWMKNVEKQEHMFGSVARRATKGRGTDEEVGKKSKGKLVKWL